MSIEVHILGTSSARPTSIRQVSGNLISCHDGIVVVDAGEGFQTRFFEQRKRMKQYDNYHLKPSKVSALCLTHGHLDHTWGVLPWLQSLALDNRHQPLLVLGPTTSQVIDALLSQQPLPNDIHKSDLAIQYRFWHQLGATSSGLGYPIRWILGAVDVGRWVEFLDDGQIIELTEMPQPEGWRKNHIAALSTIHTTPSCAWQVSSSSSPGKFDRVKAKQLALSEAEKGALASGEDIQHNGKLLKSHDFRGEPMSPLNVVISGDTAEMAPGITSLEQCSLLVHEATFLDDYTQHAEDYLHSTASGAARTALACGAEHLVLTHYGARIKHTDELIDEAMKVLASSEVSLSAAIDGDRMLVRDSGEVSHLRWCGDGWSS